MLSYIRLIITTSRFSAASVADRNKCFVQAKKDSASVATHLIDKISFLLQVEFSSFSSRFDILVDGYTRLGRNIISIVSTGLSL